MKENPLVTIITPTYNHEKFIGECIESVISQSYPNWEQIIIDDGSTDRTEEIVARYDDKRIKYIKQENSGIYNLKETYNKALKLSKGELIAVLEGDDFWPSNKLEIQIKAFEDPEVGVSCGKAELTDIEGNVIETRPNEVGMYENLSKEGLIEIFLRGNFIPACTVMCRKESLLAIGGFQQPSYAPYVDYPTWLELSLNEKFLVLDSILGYWRRHETQITTSKALEMGYSWKYSIDFYKKLDPELKKSLGITLDELVRNYDYKIANTFYYLGRKNLARHEWNEGKNNFRRAFKNGYLWLKFLSVFGLLCAYSKIDLKFLIKLGGKSPLEEYV